MGYDVERFVSREHLEELTCQICLGVFENPLQLPCEHIFCRECIHGLKEFPMKGNQCPTCRTPIGEINILKAPPRIITNILYGLTIKCNFEECPFQSKLDVMPSHQTKECDFRPVRCQNDGCTVGQSANKMKIHANICPYRLFPCEYGCPLMLTKSSMPRHLKECPKRELGEMKKYFESRIAFLERQLMLVQMNSERDSTKRLYCGYAFFLQNDILTKRIEPTMQLMNQAIESGQVDIAEILANHLKIEMDPRIMNRVIYKEDVRGLDRLIELGLDVNFVPQNNSDLPALFQAVQSNQPKCLEKLITAGANVNLQIKYGYYKNLLYTPLDLALDRFYSNPKYVNIECAIILLKAGGKICHMKQGGYPDDAYEIAKKIGVSLD